MKKENYDNLISHFNNLDTLLIMGYLWNGSPHDYGNGIELNLTEAHTLQYIIDHTNTKVTDIARYFSLTLSAASKIVSRLEKKGLILKEKHDDNKKNIYLLPTQTGLSTDQAHRQHDRNYYGEALKILMESHSLDEINHFFQVLDTFVKNHP